MTELLGILLGLGLIVVVGVVGSRLVWAWWAAKRAMRGDLG